MITESSWKGFRRIDFTFSGRKAILVFPEKACQGKWLFKTEYFEAFQDFELEMVRRGWHLAYLENHSRWCLPEDIAVKPLFCEYLHENFGLRRDCVPVGMSCGGMHAVYFAAAYPGYVAGLYLDAPVMNLLSCPCGVGDGGEDMYAEFVRDTGRTKSQLINDRNQPIDAADRLVEHRIPLFLVGGDRDRVVPFHENGALLAEKYRKAGLPVQVVVKPGCDHHPHGLTDLRQLTAFAEACCSTEPCPEQKKG